MTFSILDIWYVWILGMHKHNYARIEDEIYLGRYQERYQCTECKGIVRLDDWQIEDLPIDMLYEKIEKK